MTGCHHKSQKMEPHYNDPKIELDNDEKIITDEKITTIKNEDKNSKVLVNSASTTCLNATLDSCVKVEGVRRSNTSIEGHFRCAVTSERLNQLKKIVETAVREHKTFTIKGNFIFHLKTLLIKLLN